MDRKQRIKSYCLKIIICMLMIQLMAALVQPLTKLLSNPQIASLVIYLETGRVVKRIPSETQPAQEETTMPPQPPQQIQEQVNGISFSREDAQLIQVSNFSNFSMDIPGLLLSELSWDLTVQSPQVLILHSHATESYTQTAQNPYQPSAAYRTLDVQHNMVRVGEELKLALEAKGIQVIHDTTLHDSPAYNDAYIRSRQTVEQWLEQYPSISLVIDLHRDATGDSSVGQLRTAVTVDGVSSAQLMLVVGSNAGGRTHPNWKSNLALATKLQAQLEKRFPGICRPISFRTERFNQDLSEGALLIEVGAAGDTLEEALAAVSFLAEGIFDLAFGTVTADSTN